jgi:HAD superfamily hydrolase (TIGR01509 family)
VFDVVVSSAEVGYAKPENQIYRFALNELGLPPEAVMFIDDLPRNTQAAERVGIPAIVFTGPEELLTELRRRSIL